MKEVRTERLASGDGNSTSDRAVLSVTFDRRSSVPLYQQLKYHIIHAISTGRIAPGRPLPSVRIVSRQLGVASATVQRAYAELQGEGFVVGEAGRGVFVAALQTEKEVDEAARRQALKDVLLPPVRRVQALGFSPHEIVGEVSALVSVTSTAFLPRIVFVGRRPEAVEKYVQLLRMGIAPLSADVTGIDLQALRDSDGAVLDELRPIDLIVSLVSNFAEVRTEARRRGVKSYGLMVELSDETKRALIELPFDSKVGLLAESVFLSNTRALVEQIRGDETDLVWATEQDSPESIAEAVKDCEVVLHTFGMKVMAAELAQPGSKLIELTFLPMQASLAHLTETVAFLRSHGDVIQREEVLSFDD